MIKEARERASAGLLLIVATVALVALGVRSVRSQEPAAGLVTFRLIVVSTEAAATRLAQQIAQGSDFADLARNLSIDPTAASGGLIGPLDPATLLAELRDVLRSLALNQVGPVVRVPTGYALVQRVADRTERGGSREIAAVAADAGVKYTVSVDGFAEANTALNTLAKPDGWGQDLRLVCSLRRQAVTGVRTRLTQLLGPEQARTRATYGPQEMVEAFIALGQLHAYDGAMGEVVERIQQARALAQAEMPAALVDLDEMLGLAHLHKAGAESGQLRSPGDRCLLSTRPFAGPNLPSADLDTAIASFTKHLSADPQSLEVRWLLNVAHMFRGSYPVQVPAPWLVPPSAFASPESIGRFTDVAASSGVDSFSSAGGVVVDDFDGDGELEILTSNFESCGTMQLFRRGSDGRFTDVAAKAGLADQLGGLNLVQADYDNDGCKDVLVLRGGWELAQRKSLLHNNCNGTFTDVTAASGLAVPATSTQTAAWADVDNDGFVDLFIGNEDRASQLFRNQRDGTFEDVAVEAGVAGTAFTKGVTAADYDNDGDVDFYVSNLRSRNLLYRNDGDWHFTEVGLAAGVPGADRGFPAWFFDYDNDGWQDILASSYYLSVEESARSYLGLPQNARTMKLYRNLGNGSFADVTAAVGLDKVYMPMGSNFGDVDNDGFLDIYFGTGSPSYGALVPSVLLRNRSGQGFVDITESSGTGEWHKGHGVAFADVDHDGDLEIVFKVGGATPGDAHAFRLFDNPGQGNDWLSLDLVGATSNRSAIGARIAVRVEDASGVTRSLHRVVNSGGSFGASPLAQHIGLGKDARRVDVEILWPASKSQQRFTNVGKNQALRVREGADAYVRLERPVRRPGGRQ